MDNLSFNNFNLLSGIRFVARLFSILLTLIVLMFLIGEGFPNIYTLTNKELFLFVSLLVMLFGLLFAWKKENIGGIFILIGFVSFFAANTIFSDNLRLGFIFLLFPVTGILFLICHSINKKTGLKN